MSVDLASRRPTRLSGDRPSFLADELDALVAACALVANADGWVTHEEREGLRERMRALPALARVGVDDALRAFNALDRGFETDPDAARFQAQMAIRRLRGRPEAARSLMRAACQIAAADGGLDAEERDVLLRICALLALDPIQFELITPGRGR